MVIPKLDFAANFGRLAHRCRPQRVGAIPAVERQIVGFVIHRRRASDAGWALLRSSHQPLLDVGFHGLTCGRYPHFCDVN
jgi:hypothetical protein